MKRRIKVGLLVLNILLVLCTLLAYASPFVHPEANRIPGLFGLVFPILFFLNLLAILFWLSFGRWYALISLICLGIGYQRIGKFIQLGIHKNEKYSQILRIATYNVFSFHDVTHTESAVKQTFQQIVKDLGEPDILCLQESVLIGRKNAPVGDYRYVFQIPNCGTVLLSRYPILKSTRIEFDDVFSLSGWIDVLFREDTLRVIGLHLLSNRITEESEQILEERRFRDSKTWMIAGGLVRKYSIASAMRAYQSEQIRAYINQSPYPVIVVGDFNDTPQSYAYATVCGDDMQDSFVEKGGGIGTTYGGSIPGLRIDYILVDEHFSVTDHRVLKLDYSDHYAVVAECVLR